MMQGGSSTMRRPLPRNGSVAGSVWDTRMRVDAVNGGIKVFNGPDDDTNAADEEGMRVYRRLRRNRSDTIAAAARKRRIWTAPNASAAAETVGALTEKSPIQLRKARFELPHPTRLSAEHSAGARKEVPLIGDGSEGYGGDEKKMKGGEEVEIEMDKEVKSLDDKEMDERMEKPDEMDTEEEEEEEEKRINQIHEIPVPPAAVEKKQTPVTTSPSPTVEPKQNFPPKKEQKQTSVTTPSSSYVMKKQNPVIVQVQTPPGKKRNPVTVHRTLDPDPAKSSAFDKAEETFYDTSVNHNSMMGIVDLIMWRDASRTAFVFGLGTFFLISSSYAMDLNFSLMSVASYAGLIYLALNFVYKSILHRGQTMEYDDKSQRFMVGEEEAIWLLRMLLPYINELLFKLRRLFSGDPATTMKARFESAFPFFASVQLPVTATKFLTPASIVLCPLCQLAVLLFALARCGSSITLCGLAKMTFFGVFTVPKVCSSYSAQLSIYGKLWLERFRDGWESCNHKKAVAAAIFILIWNMSSTVARIWAVFMLVVAMKCYQQCIAEDWSHQQQEAAAVAQDSKTDQSQGLGGRHRQRGGPARNEVLRERKIKKRI